MGGIISAPLSLAATCCGSLAGTCISSALCKACGCACTASQRVTSIIYILIMMGSVFAALLFRFHGGDIVIGGGYNATASSLIDHSIHSALSGGKSFWNSRFWCAPKHPDGWILCCEDVCGGVFAVYRFSFVLCIFFASLMVCTIGTHRFGARAHRGFWFLKAFCFFVLLVTTLFMKNEDLQSYREAARYFSMLFLLMQILLLIDFGYTWNEKWIAKDEESDSDGICGWKLAILLSSAIMYIGSIAIWVVMYTQFGHSGCPAQQALISLTWILSLALTVVSCTKIAPHGTLLTSAVVTGYATYLCYSALSSHPDLTCNPMAKRNDNSTPDLLIGLLVAGISMASTALSATGSKDALIGKSAGNDDLTVSLDAGDSTAEPEDGAVEPESWWYYHLMMVACSFYMGMLLTDWSSQPATSEGGVPAVHQADGPYATSLGSFWVKVVSQWVCLLMYGWTLLAPYLLRDVRDFGIEFDD